MASIFNVVYNDAFSYLHPETIDIWSKFKLTALVCCLFLALPSDKKERSAAAAATTASAISMDCHDLRLFC